MQSGTNPSRNPLNADSDSRCKKEIWRLNYLCANIRDCKTAEVEESKDVSTEVRTRYLLAMAVVNEASMHAFRYLEQVEASSVIAPDCCRLKPRSRREIKTCYKEWRRLENSLYSSYIVTSDLLDLQNFRICSWTIKSTTMHRTLHTLPSTRRPLLS